MKKLVQFFLCCFLFCSAQASCETNANVAFCPIPNEKASFWHSPKNGANFEQTLPIEASFFTQAQENKSSFVYIPNKAFFDDINAEGKKTQKTLKRLVASAKKHNLKIVVELPGTSSNELSKDQVLLCWLPIVNQLKQYPDVVAYSIPTISSYDWVTGHDDPDFYKKAIAQIRRIDSQTPIILNLDLWGIGGNFKPIPENNILYAMKSEIVLPTVCQGPSGSFPNGDVLRAREQEATDRAKEILKYLAIWAKKQGISPYKLLISDFGSLNHGGPGSYKINDADLASFLEIIKTSGWHWSFSYPNPTTEELPQESLK